MPALRASAWNAHPPICTHCHVMSSSLSLIPSHIPPSFIIHTPGASEIPYATSPTTHPPATKVCGCSFSLEHHMRTQKFDVQVGVVCVCACRVSVAPTKTKISFSVNQSTPPAPRKCLKCHNNLRCAAATHGLCSLYCCTTLLCTLCMHEKCLLLAECTHYCNTYAGADDI